MAKLPAKVSDRIVSGIKRFQPILASAKSRDVGESDTVTIIVDMLSEIFGYDKYAEITSEHAIRGTFCDLATKIDGALQLLIEVKAIGSDLKEAHVKQAIDYAANQGVEWVVLTNGIVWRIYRVTFAKPIGQELVIEFDFVSLNHRNSKDLDSLFLLCKEGWIKSVLGEFHTQKQALSRFFLGALLMSDPVLQLLKRELRRLSPDVRVDTDEILTVLTGEVIKRDVMEGDQAKDAAKKLAKVAAKTLKTKQAKQSDGSAPNATDDQSADVEGAADSEPPDAASE